MSEASTSKPQYELANKLAGSIASFEIRNQNEFSWVSQPQCLWFKHIYKKRFKQI